MGVDDVASPLPNVHEHMTVRRNRPITISPPNSTSNPVEPETAPAALVVDRYPNMSSGSSGPATK
eukprot:12889349-Prorocentrum_lima.AAC.1